MQKFLVEIEGITPYMQHRMDDSSLEEWEKQRGRIIERNDVNKEDMTRAMFHAYLDNEGKPFIPSDHFRGAFIGAGSFLKAKVGNSKKSMKNIVAAMFYVLPEKIPLENNFVIDKRSSVNRNIKARVIVIRPKWETWKVNFELHVDNDTITEETIRNVIEYAGQYVGIGSFSPRCNGMFGRFKIVSLKKL